jgi:hypothetical protein
MVYGYIRTFGCFEECWGLSEKGHRVDSDGECAVDFMDQHNLEKTGRQSVGILNSA